MTLNKFDYEEPRCACDMDFYKEEKKITPIPVGRIIDKLNSLYEEQKLDDAVLLIKYWIKEADAGFDYKGKLTLLNELMGTQRKLGKEKEAKDAASKAIELVDKLEMQDSPTGGMTKLNAGTVYKVFGQAEKALECYKYAEKIFDKYFEQDDERYGGLYNNLASTLVDLNKFDDAKKYFERALNIANKYDHLSNEVEIIKVNMNRCLELMSENSNEYSGRSSHINGLKLAKSYYEECFKDILYNEFPHLACKTAIGLCGQGSECYGYDDKVSEDHDFEPGFCIFIPGENEVSRKDAFELERAYDKLPKEFKGYKRPLVAPVGGRRHGVLRLDEYISNYLGDLKSFSKLDWISMPSSILAELTNGEIWEDNYGKLSALRKSFLNIPEDILRKRLAGKLIIAGQSGQYNLPRCIAHKEFDAARLASYEFVNSAMDIVFLLNRKYMPYYKWSFRAMDDLKILSGLKDSFSKILYEDHDKTINLCEDICKEIALELKKQGFTDSLESNLEETAYSVNSGIKDAEIRNLNIFFASK